MNFDRLTDAIIQLLIVATFLLVLIEKFDFVLLINVIILVSSIILIGYLNAPILKEKITRTSDSKIYQILIIIAQVIFFLLLMGIIQSSIYFYFNYTNGIFESILLLFGLIAIIQGFNKFQIAHEP